jgi:hypothetical protein
MPLSAALPGLFFCLTAAVLLVRLFRHLYPIYLIRNLLDICIRVSANLGMSVQAGKIYIHWFPMGPIG